MSEENIKLKDENYKKLNKKINDLNNTTLYFLMNLLRFFYLDLPNYINKHKNSSKN